MATQLFGITGQVGIFYLSRGIEGLSGAALAPAILAHLTDLTEGDLPLRARIMSYFEPSLLAGLALGGGPIGTELAAAYQRLDSQVTVDARGLLPKDEPEARQCIEAVLAREGLRLACGAPPRYGKKPAKSC